MINPASVAFDIDGVFADTMTLFLDIAREEYDIKGIRYEDITCYTLEECVDIDSVIIEEIIDKLLKGNHTSTLKPIPGAAEVLTRLGRSYSPLLFVTARPYAGPMYEWIGNLLPLPSASIDVVATGSFEAKAAILRTRNVTHFVEDRLETCFPLKEAGITPVLFKQPWNRKPHPFVEVNGWKELETLIEF